MEEGQTKRSIIHSFFYKGPFTIDVNQEGGGGGGLQKLTKVDLKMRGGGGGGGRFIVDVN